MKRKISALTETSRDNKDIERLLDILEKDIEQHPSKLIAPSQEMKEELNKVIDDFSVDLDGDY
ncbi:AbrB/MazE/SpoVT family DNA-binding domain-containing protein [Vibrio vulnificus]|uniref:hypothetical protein n=1 Tax=Vibrio vulnificus TaxID=672 RepID=UPI00102CADFE|nr:hypothetical protein [Vibrio vulnificus]EJD0673914.1 hypothetical protein [Vibrio vulnificus]MCA4022870.1 hypothetical protein [Vibrio vulnificus]RZR39385.1 hypothetical protein D8T58_23210 [Vibrio vulnificus]